MVVRVDSLLLNKQTLNKQAVEAITAQQKYPHFAANTSQRLNHQAMKKAAYYTATDTFGQPQILMNANPTAANFGMKKLSLKGLMFILSLFAFGTAQQSCQKEDPIEPPITIVDPGPDGVVKFTDFFNIADSRITTTKTVASQPDNLDPTNGPVQSYESELLIPLRQEYMDKLEMSPVQSGDEGVVEVCLKDWGNDKYFSLNPQNLQQVLLTPEGLKIYGPAISFDSKVTLGSGIEFKLDGHSVNLGKVISLRTDGSEPNPNTSTVAASDPNSPESVGYMYRHNVPDVENYRSIQPDGAFPNGGSAASANTPSNDNSQGTVVKSGTTLAQAEANAATALTNFLTAAQAPEATGETPWVADPILRNTMIDENGDFVPQLAAGLAMVSASTGRLNNGTISPLTYVHADGNETGRYVYVRYGASTNMPNAFSDVEMLPDYTLPNHPLKPHVIINLNPKFKFEEPAVVGAILSEELGHNPTEGEWATVEDWMNQQGSAARNSVAEEAMTYVVGALYAYPFVAQTAAKSGDNVPNIHDNGNSRVLWSNSVNLIGFNSGQGTEAHLGKFGILNNMPDNVRGFGDGSWNNGDPEGNSFWKRLVLRHHPETGSVEKLPFTGSGVNNLYKAILTKNADVSNPETYDLPLIKAVDETGFDEGGLVAFMAKILGLKPGLRKAD